MTLRGKQAMVGTEPSDTAARQRRPHAPIDLVLPVLTPPHVYALVEIVRCGRLYRFGSGFCLDQVDENGELHLVSVAAVRWLEVRKLVIVKDEPIVAASEGYVHPTRLGEVASRKFYWWAPVARCWNEFPPFLARDPKARPRFARRANA